MYHILFNKITDIISDLQEIQQQTEEMFISDESDIIEIKKYKKMDSRAAIHSKKQ